MKSSPRQADASLLRRVGFDSEASMFCAFGTDLEALGGLAAPLRAACGETEEDAAAALGAVSLPDYADVEDLL